MIIKRKKRNLEVNRIFVYINTSFNNTLIYLTDIIGNVLVWSSAGMLGFKGSRKGTPYAAGVAAKEVCKMFKEVFCLDVLKVSAEVFLKGPGTGGESAVRSIGEFFLITKISNITTIPHNGCRPKKMRRV